MLGATLPGATLTSAVADADSDSFPLLRLDAVPYTSSQILSRSQEEWLPLLDSLRGDVSAHSLLHYGLHQYDVVQAELARRSAARRVGSMLGAAAASPEPTSLVAPPPDPAGMMGMDTCAGSSWATGGGTGSSGATGTGSGWATGGGTGTTGATGTGTGTDIGIGGGGGGGGGAFGWWPGADAYAAYYASWAAAAAGYAWPQAVAPAYAFSSSTNAFGPLAPLPAEVDTAASAVPIPQLRSAADSSAVAESSGGGVASNGPNGRPPLPRATSTAAAASHGARPARMTARGAAPRDRAGRAKPAWLTGSSSESHDEPASFAISRHSSGALDHGHAAPEHAPLVRHDFVAVPATTRGSSAPAVVEKPAAHSDSEASSVRHEDAASLDEGAEKTHRTASQDPAAIASSRSLSDSFISSKPDDPPAAKCRRKKRIWEVEAEQRKKAERQRQKQADDAKQARAHAATTRVATCRSTAVSTSTFHPKASTTASTSDLPVARAQSGAVAHRKDEAREHVLRTAAEADQLASGDAVRPQPLVDIILPIGTTSVAVQPAEPDTDSQVDTSSSSSVSAMLALEPAPAYSTNTSRGPQRDGSIVPCMEASQTTSVDSSASPGASPRLSQVSSREAVRPPLRAESVPASLLSAEADDAHPAPQSTATVGASQFELPPSALVPRLSSVNPAPEPADAQTLTANHPPAASLPTGGTFLDGAGSDGDAAAHTSTRHSIPMVVASHECTHGAGLYEVEPEDCALCTPDNDDANASRTPGPLTHAVPASRSGWTDLGAPHALPPKSLLGSLLGDASSSSSADDSGACDAAHAGELCAAPIAAEAPASGVTSGMELQEGLADPIRDSHRLECTSDDTNAAPRQAIESSTISHDDYESSNRKSPPANSAPRSPSAHSGPVNGHKAEPAPAKPSAVSTVPRYDLIFPEFRHVFTGCLPSSTAPAFAAGGYSAAASRAHGRQDVALAIEQAQNNVLAIMRAFLSDGSDPLLAAQAQAICSPAAGTNDDDDDNDDPSDAPSGAIPPSVLPIAPAPATIAQRSCPYIRYYRVAASHREVAAIVRRALASDPSWQEVPATLETLPVWNLMWAWGKPPIHRNMLLTWQKVNHFRHARELSRKDLLKKNLARYQVLGARMAAAFSLQPPTFVLPKEYLEFAAMFGRGAVTSGTAAPKQALIPVAPTGDDTLAKLMRALGVHEAVTASSMQSASRVSSEPTDVNIWIMKPAGLSRGRGITLVTDIAQVQYAENMVIQRYIHNPLLLDGYKFDLRLYVLVTSFAPLEAFLYRRGFARVSSRPFSIDAAAIADKFIHLTNSSIQRHSATATATVAALPGASAAAVGGTKCSLEYLWQRLAERGIDTNKLWDNIRDVVVKSLVCVDDVIPPQPNSFELFGYDILIDDTLKPWLIEVNSSPSLGVDSPLDLSTKTQLIADTIALVDPIPFDRAALVDVLQRRSTEADAGTGAASGKTGASGTAARRRARPQVSNAVGPASAKSGLSTEHSQAELNSDLRRILHETLPRPVGALPRMLGAYEPLCPGTDVFNRVMKLKLTHFRSTQALREARQSSGARLPA